MKDTNDLPLTRAIRSLAVPAVLAFLLQNFYHVNDTWFLAQVGPESANALGLFMIVSVANFGFILTVARGTQSLLARRFGAGNLKGAEQALAQGIRLAGMVLIPLGVAEYVFMEDILGLMGGTGSTVELGAAYMRRLLLFFPFLFASPLFEFCFQGLGDTRTPFRLQVMAVGVNTLLNWLLVLPHEIVSGPAGLSWGEQMMPFSLPWEGQLSFGGWGVVGAATATGCSRMCSAVLGFFLLVRRHQMRSLVSLPSYRLRPKVVGEILRVGLPAGSSTLLYATVGVVLTQIISRFGQDALGAYGIGFRGVEGVSFMVVLGFGVASGTVAAHAVGAGNLARARAAGHVGAAMCAGVMAVTTTAFFFWPEVLVGFFTDDPTTLGIASGYITIMACCQIPQAAEMVYGDAMAGAGSAMLAACVSIPGNVLRVPLAWLFAVELDWGLEGVWWAIVASALFKGLGMTLLYLSGRWERGMLAGRGMLDSG
ncbi:MAG: Na+-driven multidrug efflux pump [Pseudohongiellaceae bacterium]